MQNFRIIICVLIVLSASRFIPHPPNFTSLIALSFYVPAFFGLSYLPVVVISLAITDLIIGFHSTILFTWGSVILIGLFSKYFLVSYMYRISGALIGAILFYLLTNFGVWLGGSYGYNMTGLVNCYILALPFFGYTLISTILFSCVIEILYSIYKKKTQTLKF